MQLINNWISTGDTAVVRNLSLKSLLPDTNGYMTYEGSTTHPGCWETAVWLILNKPIYITAQEVRIRETRNLSSRIRLLLCFWRISKYVSYNHERCNDFHAWFIRLDANFTSHRLIINFCINDEISIILNPSCFRSIMYAISNELRWYPPGYYNITNNTRMTERF